MWSRGCLRMWAYGVSDDALDDEPRARQSVHDVRTINHILHCYLGRWFLRTFKSSDTFSHSARA